MPVISNFRLWRNGEVFNANDYVYERNTIVNQLNRLTGILGDGGTPAPINASSITMGGQTATAFEQIGSRTFLQNTTPNSTREGDLWFDTSE